MTPYRVLLIDDDIDLARMIQLGLTQSSDLIFRHAPTGQHGVQIADDDPPDLILLDFEMPMMDGLDTLRRLRANARTARTPIVAITGSHHNAPRCAEMIAASDAYLPKPFRLNALRSTLSRMLSAPGGAA
jgi:DNA-binding response OmpR family regulator